MPAMRAALSLSLALLSLFALGESDITQHGGPKRVQVSDAYGKLPITFEANQGQTNPRTRFLSRGPGYSLFLTSDRVVFALRGNGNGDAQDDGSNSKGAILQMKLVQSNRSPHIVGTDLLPGKSNYIIGRDTQKWQTSVSEYARVRYESVYPGVDLVLYGSQGRLEYDLVVAPGTDPHVIRFDVDGADSVRRDDNGDLLLQVSGKNVRWRKPVVYQEKDGIRHEINGHYVIRHKKRVSFELAGYDSTRLLVIDPVLLYSTYLGGSGYDRGNGIAVDSAGNAYITGYTASSNFPTANPLQSTCTASCGDAFVVKLDSSGALVYSTFLGGTLGSGGYAIAVDSAGQAFVAGWTEATDFPTLNPMQPACGGNCVDEDGFVSVLNPTGSALVYSTYLGGSGTDYATSIAVDTSGNAYVTGSTNSTDFPIVAALESSCVNCASPTLYSHGFITEISPSGSPAVFSTFLGGSGDDHGNSIAVDSAGNSYITGSTSSTDFPTASAFQSTCSACVSGSSYTAFVSKIAASGTSLAYSTYLGGSSGDQGNGIAVDNSGSAYVTGDTFSTDFPTVNPLESKPTGGVTGEDAFVAKLSETGSSLIYSTYLGGIEPDLGQSIAVDVAGNAYVAGWTQSTDFPTSNPIQSTYGGGDYDAFVSVINSSGSAYVYSTYFGGSESDQARGIAVDSLGNAYLTGSTTSTNFQNVSATQASNGGNGDAFITKILPSVSATTVTLASSLNPAAENQVVTLIAMVAGQQGGTPTGTVTFENGTASIGTVTLSDGFASFNQSFAISGTEPIVAAYSGDATFAASSSPVLYEGVGGYPSITSLTATPTPSTIGQSVIFNATVTSTYGSPTGTVTLMNGSTSIGTASLVSGLATFTETFSSPGMQSITAWYSGDVSFAGSVSSALEQTVMANFTLTLSGTGAGSVSSLDGKINGCTIAGGANCSTTYTSGSLVTLVPTPANGSSFYWSSGVTGVPCSGSGACTITISNNTTASGVFTSTGFSAIQASPTFSIDYNASASQFPTGIRHGQGRFWDTPNVEWAFVQTSACTTSPCPNSFAWSSVDALLSTMAQNSVYTAQYALARTPSFLSSNPSDSTCHGGLGECDAPSDLSFDGTGANLIWRNWVAAISAHVNSTGYTDTHAHVQYWEIWNEPDTLAFWGGNAPASQGTFDQLVRMEEDAYCIIKGGSFINDYTGESCTAVLATVTSVSLTAPTDPTAVVVMPSYHGGSTSLALAACFLYGTGASGGLCQSRSLHYGGSGAAHTDAINFHMKPGALLNSQMDSWITAIQQILAAPELAKPLYNTEGGYSGEGWTSPFDTPDMEEAYVGQFYVYSTYKAIANTVWYSYSPIHGGIGESAPPNDANTAYSNVYNWMVGSSVPVCTLNSDGTNPSSLYICTTTLANGVAAQVMWDISPSLYCSGSGCPTLNQSVSSSYQSYLDLAGNKTPITGQSVPVGVKPVLVQAQ